MALVASGYEVRVTFTDEAGNSSTRTYQAGAGVTTPALAATAAAALVADLAAMTSATITSYSVAQKFSEDTSFLGGAGSEVENQAQITLKIDDPDPKKTWTTTVPSPLIGIFVAPTGANKNVVDGTDVLVTGLIANFQTTGGSFAVSDGETIEDTNPFVKGKRVHKASQNG